MKSFESNDYCCLHISINQYSFTVTGTVQFIAMIRQNDGDRW